MKWEEKEREKTESRILKLKDNQIGELFEKVGIKFLYTAIEEIVSELKENELNSINLDILMREANTKGNLFAWIEYFERNNQPVK